MITTYAAPRNVRGELLAAVVTRGHEVTVLAPEPEAVMGPPLAAIGAAYVQWPVARAALDPLADAAAVARLTARLRQLAPDVVLIYQIKAVLLAVVAARLARVPRVVVLVNGLGLAFHVEAGEYGHRWQARAARVVYKQALRLADEVIFHNRDDAELLQRLGILTARARWSVVPGSGVEVAALAAVPPPPTVPVTFTLVSRMLGAKGVREFAAAARALHVRYPGARFQLVGPLEAAGHPDAIAQHELAAWAATGSVAYLGVSADIPGVLAGTTVVVLPSYREGLPRTNLEAMAAARAVVTTDAPGCRDTVIDGQTGVLVPPRDAPALAAALERYLRDPELAVRHGAAGRLFVERFDVLAINAQMLQLLHLT